MVGRSVGQKKKWTLQGAWVPEKAGLLSKKAWLQSQHENVVFLTIKCLMLIKDKYITSYQELLLIKQDRVLVN